MRDGSKGVAGVAACSAPLAQYSQCMRDCGADKKLKLTRAPAAYLPGGDAREEFSS